MLMKLQHGMIAISLLMVAVTWRPIGLYAQSQMQDLIPGKMWVAPDISLGYISFNIDGSYEIGAYEGAGVFARGKYVVAGADRLSLTPPDITNPALAIAQKTARWAEDLWRGSSLSLSYDSQYADLLYTGALRNNEGKIVFVSTNPTLEGRIVDYHNVKVIKQKAIFIVQDNLIMRREPTQSSESNYYSTNDILSKYGYGNSKNLKSRILPRGFEVETEGHTVATADIDGRNAPWYLYSLQSEGDIIYQGWIFGGYLLPLTQEQSQKYKSEFERQIRALGWVDQAESQTAR